MSEAEDHCSLIIDADLARWKPLMMMSYALHFSTIFVMLLPLLVGVVANTIVISFIKLKKMDPEVPLKHSRIWVLSFDNALDAGAWEINPGALSAIYVGPSTEVIGTVAAAPQQRTQVVETCRVSLPPAWLYIQYLIDHGLLDPPPEPIQPEPLQVELPALPPIEVAAEEVEEDPVEYLEDDPEFPPPPVEDEDSYDEDVGGQAEVPDGPVADGGGHQDLPNGFC